jgi:hypothetical protein
LAAIANACPRFFFTKDENQTAGAYLLQRRHVDRISTKHALFPQK